MIVSRNTSDADIVISDIQINIAKLLYVFSIFNKRPWKSETEYLSFYIFLSMYMLVHFSLSDSSDWYTTTACIC